MPPIEPPNLAVFCTVSAGAVPRTIQTVHRIAHLYSGNHPRPSDRDSYHISGIEWGRRAQDLMLPTATSLVELIHLLKLIILISETVVNIYRTTHRISFLTEFKRYTP